MSDTEFALETETRLMILEMVVSHLVANYLVVNTTEFSEHFKETLINKGPKIDQTTLQGPTDVTALEGGKASEHLRLKMAEFLARLESTEHRARQAAEFPQVEPVANRILSDLLGKPSPYDPS